MAPNADQNVDQESDADSENQENTTGETNTNQEGDRTREIGASGAPEGGMPAIVAWQNQIWAGMTDNPEGVRRIQKALDPGQ